MTALRPAARDRTGHCKHLPALVQRMGGGIQRARAGGGLDHDHGGTESTDQTVSAREMTAHRGDVQTELRQQRSILAPDVVAQKQRDLESRYGELRREAEQAGGGFNRAVSVAMIKLRQEMAKIVTQVMKEKGVNITVARAAVLVFDEKLNITPVVLTRLNKKVPKIRVDFKAAERKQIQKKR